MSSYRISVPSSIRRRRAEARCLNLKFLYYYFGKDGNCKGFKMISDYNLSYDVTSISFLTVRLNRRIDRHDSI
jgi:hypothetical protein